MGLLLGEPQPGIFDLLALEPDEFTFSIIRSGILDTRMAAYPLSQKMDNPEPIRAEPILLVPCVKQLG